MWLDDQAIVGAHLWPPSSVVNVMAHRMGREAVADGLYFKILAELFPLHPVFYYAVNFMFHLGTLAFLIVGVFKSTRNLIISTVAGLLAAFASTGPEVFLTLFKLEGRMMFFVSIFVVLLSGLQPDRGPSRRIAAGMFLSVVASGVWGKETFVLIYLGGATALVGLLVLKGDFSRPRLRAMITVVLTIVSGIAAVALYRYLIGVSGVMQGSYSGSLLSLVPSLTRLRNVTFIYSLVASDVLIGLSASCMLLLGVVALRRTRASPMSSWSVVGAFACGGALAVCLFHILVFEFLHVYYLYPVGLLAPVGLACLYFGVAKDEGRTILSLAPLVVFASVLLGFSIPQYLNRIYAHHKVATAEDYLMNVISALPARSLILLPFSPHAEQIGNLSVLMRYLRGRTDLEFASWLGSDVKERVRSSGESGRPAFSIVIYDEGQNWRVGGRGLAAVDRTIAYRKMGESGLQCTPLLSHRTGPKKLYRPPDLTALAGYGFEPYMRFAYHWDLCTVSQERG
jgi:hypothetical protein